MTNEQRIKAANEMLSSFTPEQNQILEQRAAAAVKPTKNDYSMFVLQQIAEANAVIQNWQTRLIAGNLEISEIIRISNIMTKFNRQ